MAQTPGHHSEVFLHSASIENMLINHALGKELDVSQINGLYRRSPAGIRSYSQTSPIQTTYFTCRLWRLTICFSYQKMKCLISYRFPLHKEHVFYAAKMRIARNCT